MFSKEVYQKRREILRHTIGSGQLLILGNSNSSINFKDNWYPFRQDSTFLYYFGVSLPGLVGVLDCDSGEDYLVGDDLSIEDFIWTGPQPKMMDWAERVGVSKSFPNNKLQSMLKVNVHFLPPYRSDHYLMLGELLGINTAEVTQRHSIPFIIAVANQRNIKSSEEIVEINKAVNITSAMHLKVMQSARQGMKEYELVGIASKVAREHNVEFSFLPILTTNGQTLHNHYYGNTLEQGDMVLFDGGTESQSYYTGDMTRTFPVGASFTSKQKEIYDVVYAAHDAAVKALRPGMRFLDIHLLAAQKLVSGLCEIGLMRGDPEEAVKAGAHTLFFQCGLGHMMGLDVHDMENLGEEYVGYTDQLKKSSEFGLKSLRLGRLLEAGFVLTVEPGIYLIPELIDLFKNERKYIEFVNYDLLDTYWDFGGIRIEEDFVITRDGSELLGNKLATKSYEIEEIRKLALA